MTRRCDVIKLAATQSFTAIEVDLLHQLLLTALRGGDVRVLVGRPEVAGLLRKARTMKKTIKRQRKRREELASEIGTRDPQRSRRRDGL